MLTIFILILIAVTLYGEVTHHAVFSSLARLHFF